jgi:uncharacterized protein
MSEQDNVQVAQQAFEAFGRGDIPALLGLVSDDVVWDTMGPANVIPWASRRQGPEQVGQFFSDLTGAVEFQQLQPREFIAQGDRVVVLGHSDYTVRANGRPLEQDWVMVLKLRDGKVAEYQYFEDTAATVAALQGS